MATEILSVPEEHLQEVIDIIRLGIKNSKNVSIDVSHPLLKWCKEEQAYLKRLQND